MPRVIDRADGRSIAFGIAVFAVVALAPTTALAQTLTQTPPLSGPPATAQSDGRPPDTEPAGPDPARSIPIDTAVDQQGALRNFSRAWNWHFEVGSQNGCPGCAANGLQPPANPNAPWSMRGQLTYAGSRGTQITLGAIGSRNNQLPLFMFQPLGSDQDLTPPVSSFANMSRTAIQWQLTAAFKKTLKQTPGGQTISLVGDVFIPIASKAKGRGAADAPVVQSKAGRLGLALGF